MKILPLIIILFMGYFVTITSSDRVHTNIPNEKEDATSPDSTDNYRIVRPESSFIEDPAAIRPTRYNPFRVVLMSAFIPGLGQFYCKERIRGSIFFSSVLISYLFSKNRWDRFQEDLKEIVKEFDNRTLSYKDTLSNIIHADTAAYKKYYNLYISSYMESDLARYRRQTGRFNALQGFGWTLGFYIWNVVNAFHYSNHLHDNEPRNPKTAAWLSAIPFLGLGQIYNGSFQKAGFIWTTHTMLSIMAFNTNKQMNKAIDFQNKIKNTESISLINKNNFYDQWEGEYNSAFRQRNTWLWYLFILYFYGIFDAAVDAHLHDYKKKIKLRPDVIFEDESLSFKIELNGEF
ncbi:MAG: DUF5683 domain-containing protein [Chitinispirillia bacterium]|jgi:hypothetical protein